MVLFDPLFLFADLGGVYGQPGAHHGVLAHGRLLFQPFFYYCYYYYCYCCCFWLANALVFLSLTVLFCLQVTAHLIEVATQNHAGLRTAAIEALTRLVHSALGLPRIPPIQVCKKEKEKRLG
jgi:hypothetical protein